MKSEHPSFLFSIHIGCTETYRTYEEYLSHVDRVTQGVLRLLKPLDLHPRVELRRRIENTGGPSEWMDVLLAHDTQQDFIADLERSLGSDLTRMEIEKSAVLTSVQLATRQLRHFMHRRVLPSIEFIELTKKLPKTSGVIALGMRSAKGEKTLTIRYASGQTDVSPIPNRRMSAITEICYDLTFKPLLVGQHRASVQLCSASKREIGLAANPIIAHWSADMPPDWSTRIVTAMENSQWMTCDFRVVQGSTGMPKRLLLNST